MSLLIVVLVVALAALAYAAFNFTRVKRMQEGTDEMQEIAGAIRVGADAFIKYEYKVLCGVVVIVGVVLGVVVSWYTGISFLIGTLMSGAAGWFGMKMATYANVRVANRARETENLGATLRVAFQGGSVMGLCVGGFALLGMFFIYLIFGRGLGMLEVLEDTTNWMGITFVPFTMCLTGYSLGCSIIAMFNRVGGGIYTKAADMGADLVGKKEAHLPEDDSRNPATIADNVGDNVGDVAGLGSDLLESYVGAIAAAMILGVHIYLNSNARGTGMQVGVVSKLFYYPMAFAAGGLFACLIGITFLLTKKMSDNPHRELNGSTYISAGLTIIFGVVITWLMFRDTDLTGVGFHMGVFSPLAAAAVGVVTGILIGMLADYYTNYDYNPTIKIANASKEGAALTIIQGLAIGMISCMAPLLVLGMALIIAYYSAGLFGVAMAGVGMLSFVTATVSVDTYGPISDNAGGIAEMSKLKPEVRAITDELDAVGNTTAAMGKGFAIGSASFAALSLMISYLYSFNDPSVQLAFDIIQPIALAGGLVGAALPFLFSGLLMEAVAKAAGEMVEEVRRQFKEKPGILRGEVKPDYKTCIEISSQGALKEMKAPALISILVPLVSGFIFGPYFVGGLLIGATFSAIMLAVFTGNAGGAWDNAKKFIETGAVDGQGKGTPVHEAAVVGDTVGDPLKDTVGPSLDILIKIMSTISLTLVPVFSKFNLFTWITNLVK